MPQVGYSYREHWVHHSNSYLTIVGLHHVFHIPRRFLQLASLCSVYLFVYLIVYLVVPHCSSTFLIAQLQGSTFDIDCLIAACHCSTPTLHFSMPMNHVIVTLDERTPSTNDACARANWGCKEPLAHPSFCVSKK